MAAAGPPGDQLADDSAAPRDEDDAAIQSGAVLTSRPSSQLDKTALRRADPGAKCAITCVDLVDPGAVKAQAASNDQVTGARL
jgi:hypothetical protein